MGYFANGAEGAAFDEQCSKWRYDTGACPIEQMQSEYNYEAANNEVATNILNTLVKDNGDCMMFLEFKEDFERKNSNPIGEK